jgi:DNA repair protein RadC
MTTTDSLLLQTPARYEQPILKTMPLREQPAYRITQNANACNITELMAAVIGGQKQIEISQALLAHFDGDIRRLFQAHPAELAKVKGVSQATAIRIKAALNLGLRLNLPKEERPTVNSPADAAALVMYEMSLLEKEHLRVILLDRRNHVLEIVEIYQGSVNSSQVRVGEIFKPAIARTASAVVVVHSHPSGDPTPSPDDVAVTRAMVQAGKLLDCEVLDHLVIGHGGKWVSLKERGLGFG